jgi:vacuolar-type H+-ATPase subunit I/STV1
MIYFTGIGVLLSTIGAANMALALMGTSGIGFSVIMGAFTLSLGLFFLIYMNYRTQRIARQAVLESRI